MDEPCGSQELDSREPVWASRLLGLTGELVSWVCYHTGLFPAKHHQPAQAYVSGKQRTCHIHDGQQSHTAGCLGADHEGHSLGDMIPFCCLWAHFIFCLSLCRHTSLAPHVFPHDTGPYALWILHLASLSVSCSGFQHHLLKAEGSVEVSGPPQNLPINTGEMSMASRVLPPAQTPRAHHQF